MLGGGCQSSITEKIRYLSLWDSFIGVPSAEILQLDLTEKVILPDGTEALLSEISPLLKQANLLVVAEGLAQRIIDICDYDITTKPILRRSRIPKESCLTGHWCWTICRVNRTTRTSFVPLMLLWFFVGLPSVS